MVGLPARGKTFIARKLRRYLQWLGLHTQLFNVGNYRRKISGAEVPHDFFDPNNPTGQEQRAAAAKEALKDMLNWFVEGEGVVGIYDATNSTKARRNMLYQACCEHHIKVQVQSSRLYI
jgi:6-phosphofructo-2-kinase/fructose-2,6-biphosphatase 2